MNSKEEVQHDEIASEEHAQLKKHQRQGHGMVDAAHLFQGMVHHPHKRFSITKCR